MKTIMKKIDFWSIVEMGMWIMCALWAILFVAGFWNMVIDNGMTTTFQWCILSGAAGLAIKALREEPH